MKLSTPHTMPKMLPISDTAKPIENVGCILMIASKPSSGVEHTKSVGAQPPKSKLRKIAHANWNNPTTTCIMHTKKNLFADKSRLPYFCAIKIAAAIGMSSGGTARVTGTP